MKPYAFALILVRFLSLGLAIYFSFVLTSLYQTSTGNEFMPTIQAIQKTYWCMLGGSVVLFLIAPLLAKLLSMGTDRD